MYAGLFDVLHDSGDDHIFAIGDRIDVHFRRIFEELIDEDWTLRIREAAELRGLHNVLLNSFQIVGNNDRAPTENVARTHEYRKTNLRCDGDRFGRSERRAAARLRNTQFRQKSAEAAAIFGKVD